VGRGTDHLVLAVVEDVNPRELDLIVIVRPAKIDRHLDDLAGAALDHQRMLQKKDAAIPPDNLTGLDA
jgi:hypothetical protein